MSLLAAFLLGVARCETLSADSMALGHLYGATGGSRWNDSRGWLSGAPCKTHWQGVTCLGGRVIGVNLTSNGLSGTVPTEIALIDSLVSLELPGNALFGEIPTALGSLKALSGLALDWNALSGTIPTQVGSIRGLKSLGLYHNMLSGTLPSVPTGLELLSMGDSHVSGTLPTQLRCWTNLTTLSWSVAPLSGTLPADFRAVTALSYLNLGDNRLSGTLPMELTELASLTGLAIDTNALSGTLPTSLARLTALSGLYVDTTSVSGTLPTQLGHMHALRNLELGWNQISGTLPTSLATLPVLMRLDVDNNRRLSGTVPPAYSRLASLELLQFSFLHLSGTTPANLLWRCAPFGRLDCPGLPPASCSGFGPSARLSLSTLGRCVICPDGTTRQGGLGSNGARATLAKLIGGATLVPLALGVYVRALNRHPRRSQLQAWVASASIALTYLQVVGTLSSLTALSAVHGSFAEALRSALIFTADLGVLSPQCLLPQQQPLRTKSVPGPNGSSLIVPVFDPLSFVTSASFLGAAAAIAIPTIAMLALTAAKLSISRRASLRVPSSSVIPAVPTRATSAEVATASSPLIPPAAVAQPPITSPPPSPPDILFAAGAMVGAGAGVAPVAKSAGPLQAATMSAPLLAPLIATTASGRLTAEAVPAASHTVPIPMTSCLAPESSQGSCNQYQADRLEDACIIVYSLQLPGACRVGLHALALSLYGGEHISLVVALPLLVLEATYACRLLLHLRARQGLANVCGIRPTALTDDRLDVRLAFLMCKYRSGAPGWQFVLWARQLALIAIGEVFQARPDEPAEVLAEGVATVAVLGAALALHWRTQPYVHRHQNIAEAVLAALSIIFVVGACAFYRLHTHLGAVSASVFEATLVSTLLAPGCVILAWLMASGGHRPWVPAELQRTLLTPMKGGGVTLARPLGEFSVNSANIIDHSLAVAVANEEASALRTQLDSQGQRTLALQASVDSALHAATAAVATAAAAAATAEGVRARQGVRPDLVPLVKHASVRVGLIERATGKVIEMASGTLVDGGPDAPRNQVLTCAHIFLDHLPFNEAERVLVRVPPGASNGDTVEVVRDDGSSFRTTVPTNATDRFVASPPNAHYLQPRYPAEMNWAALDSEMLLAIAMYEADDQPSRWAYWAELVTPIETLQRLEESPHANGSGMHEHSQLLDLAVLRILGRLEIDEPAFRGTGARYLIACQHPASADLAGPASPLPRGRSLGDPSALSDHCDTISAFGWPSPLGEVTLYSDSAPLQSRSKGLLASRVIIHSGSSGGAAVNHHGHIVAVNSMSSPPALPLPPDYKSYMRMVSWLLPEHGLQLGRSADNATPLTTMASSTPRLMVRDVTVDVA